VFDRYKKFKEFATLLVELDKRIVVVYCDVVRSVFLWIGENITMEEALLLK